MDAYFMIIALACELLVGNNLKANSILDVYALMLFLTIWEMSLKK